MAYSKQTWTDDVSAVTGARMTHIEQGIYDNSLATDKINPSGTATTTAEIEEGQINDVIGFKSLKLKGQTSQYTTTGKQLLYGSEGSKTSNGVTFTENTEDGSIRINGTATANTPFEFFDKTWTEFPAGTYRLSGAPTGSTTSTYRLVCWKEGWSVLGTDLGSGTTITLSEATNIRVQIVIASGTAVNNIVFKPMLESGSTTHEWEKYSGEKASPNPDFPQDVNNVSGDNVIKISNKNLWGDLSFTKISGGLTFVLNKDGSITISGTSTGANASSMLVSEATSNNIFVTLQAGTYTVSGGGSNYQIQIYSTSGTSLASTAVGQASKTFTLNEETDLFCRILVPNSNTTLNKTIYVQLEKGSSATTYIAHQGNNFDIDLPVENKLPYPYVDTTKTNNGITYTDLKDGRIKVNGTATANSAFALYGTASSQITLDANYVYGGVNSNVRVRVMNRSSSGTYTTLGNSIGTSTKIDRSTASTGYVEISIASGTTVNNLIITPMLSDNEVNAFTPYNENPIELCKISTYQDYIYKKDGKWWKHKQVRSQTFNGSETWTTRTASTGAQLYETDVTGYFSTQSISIGYSNHYIALIDLTNDNTFRIMNGNKLAIHNDTIGSLADFKTFLSSNNLIVYYPLATPIEEEITYTPLIRQLDELYNSGLYDVTNISQDNSSEVFILDIEACKNNINGIVEYIRR